MYLILQSTAHAMMSYSDEIYDGLPTTFIACQYLIKWIGNQIVSANLTLLEVSYGSEFYCLTNYYVRLN